MDSLVVANGSIVIVGVPVPAPSAPDAFDGGAMLGAGFAQESALVGVPVQGIPEPGSAALVFGGLLTMLGLRRRR